MQLQFKLLLNIKFGIRKLTHFKEYKRHKQRQADSSTLIFVLIYLSVYYCEAENCRFQFHIKKIYDLNQRSLLRPESQEIRS